MISRIKKISWCDAVFFSVLLLNISFAAEHNKRAGLRRKRIATEIDSKAYHDGTQEILEDLWELEAAQAEMAAVRLLGQASMSVSEPPTNAPTAGPTLKPSPPPSDTCLAGRTREKFLYDTIVQTTSSIWVEDPGTPQGKAYQWLLMDEFLADPCQFEEYIPQRFALATLYHATNGGTWTDNSLWLNAEYECGWFGIKCDAAGLNVIKIELPNNNLDGTIPEEISSLHKLENLGLFANSLKGKIPNGFKNLTNMVLLDIERNELSGDIIPDFLEGMTMLGALRLSRNKLSGTIPSFIGKLTDLQQIWLGHNVPGISGTIPTTIGGVTKLQTLFLYENRIVGKIPSEIGKLTNLTNIRLDSNMVEGAIPENFWKLTKLQNLRLDGNYLEGELSPSIGALTDLVDLRMNKNNFVSEVPAEFGKLTNLKNLIMWESMLKGKLPDIFADYKKLEQVDFSQNGLEGTIHASLFEIPSLRLVYLSNNSLTGTIPQNFQNPPVLRDLWLDGNRLSGTIPKIDQGRLQAFNEFLVQNNRITGDMPQAICNLRYDAILDDLFADCGGATNLVNCTYPACCNRCFEGKIVSAERRQLRDLKTR